MTPAEHRDVVKRLSMPQERAALMAGYHPRTGQRWCDSEGKGPPEAVAQLVKLVERNRALEEELLRLRVRVRVLERMGGS